MFNVKENSDTAQPKLSPEHEFNYRKVASGVQNSAINIAFVFWLK